MSSVREIAGKYLGCGYSIIPIRANGSKSPALPWKAYSSRRATYTELDKWYADGTNGIGVVCGCVSGGLEVIDIDDPYIVDPYYRSVESIYPNLFDTISLPIVETPKKGRHIYFRSNIVAGNQKLAQETTSDGRAKTMIETRGEGGYTIAPGSPSKCHPLNEPYRLISGNFRDVPVLSAEQRSALLLGGTALNRHTPRHMQVKDSIRYNPIGALSPGNDYNARTSWVDILLPHGWNIEGERNGLTYWRRPGKRHGVSAASGVGSDLLWVFSSNAYPFEPNESYTKFGAFTLLECNGDFHLAAERLKVSGYGRKPALDF